MTIFISDQADEFRIEISGRFSDSVVREVETAWTAALRENTPRRISVDITRMTGYDSAGKALLFEIHAHGTHIVAGTPRSLLFLDQISRSPKASAPVAENEGQHQHRRPASGQILAMPFRAAASGE